MKTPASLTPPHPSFWSEWLVGAFYLNAMGNPLRSSKLDNLFHTLVKGMLFSLSFSMEDFSLAFDFSHNWCGAVWSTYNGNQAEIKETKEAVQHVFYRP